MDPGKRIRPMKQRLINAERLIGRVVCDLDNKKAGRIEEIEIEDTGSGCFVDGFVLGEEGLLRRLSFRGIGPLFIRSLADKPTSAQCTVPWQKMDLRIRSG